MTSQNPAAAPEYLPPILAFVPYRLEAEQLCPCGSHEPYVYCCERALKDIRWKALIEACDKFFTKRVRSRTYYLYRPQPKDFIHPAKEKSCPPA